MKKNVAVLPLLFSILTLSLFVSFATASFAEISIGISVRVGPPALPVYAQPLCPGPGYLWTPGYWAWSDDDGYYWVPGTWVVAPVGMLWTPGYWGWNEGFYLWHAGYWGPHVGFYGGINYGYGYGGFGYGGGEWRGRSFYYNRSVTNVNVTNVTNVYNKTVIVNNTRVNNVSYNGGTGGVAARPTRQELDAEREPHRVALAAQTQHEHAASQNRRLFASENHGRPAIAATARPGDFTGHNIVAAKAAGARYRAPAMSPREARGPSPNVNRSGNVPSGKENSNANGGFRKFGQPSKSETPNNGRPGNTNNRGPNNWNANVARPGNTPNGKQSSNSDSGFQKFGQPANGNNGPRNTNNDWHANRPNGNGPRPASQPTASSNSSRGPRGPNQTQEQNRPSQPHPVAPRTSGPHKPSPPPQPRENSARDKERHQGKER